MDEARVTDRAPYPGLRPFRPEEIDPRIGDTAECAIALGVTGNHEGRAERAFVLVRVLVIEVVGEILRGDGSHVRLQILVEQRRGARGEARRP